MESVLAVVMLVGLATGLFDMAGNGSINARWAPYGLGAALVSGTVLYFGYGWH